MNLGLSVSDVVNVQVSLSPTAAALRNFGLPLVLGDSGVIDTTSRYRLYSSLTQVSGDFPTGPEYQAAAAYFGQSPTPTQLYIGAWARTATSGSLTGGVLGASAQALANFTAVTSGGFTIVVDGTSHALTSINLSAVSNLNGVASALQTALAGIATVVWNAANSEFIVTSATSGASSVVGLATPPFSGTDISGLMGLNAGGSAVGGIAAETALAAVQTLANMTNNWYGLAFAASVMPSDADVQAVGTFIQGLSVSRIFGNSTQEAAALNASSTTDIASVLQALKLTRTFTQYSSSSPYSAVAIFGDAFTVDFDGSNTLYTLKFKQEAGITAETLTETQAATLTAKNCNVFVNYNNGTAILQQGVMASGQFFDVIHGTDWLQNKIQTDLFNLFYTSKTKIPQTDAGVNQEITTVSASLDQAVTNDLIGPGVWNGPAFGAIATGQTLSKGYYVYAPPIATQTPAVRATRASPLITAAIKFTGAIHDCDVLLNCNA